MNKIQDGDAKETSERSRRQDQVTRKEAKFGEDMGVDRQLRKAHCTIVE